MKNRNPARLSVRKRNQKIVESDESSASYSDESGSSDIELESDSDKSNYRKKVNKLSIKSSSGRMNRLKALGSSDIQGYYQVMQSIDNELKDLSDQVRKLQSEAIGDTPKKSPNKPQKNNSNYLTQQPQSLEGGQLKHYQLSGLNWMISLYEKHLNGILADQMGLGKTIQTIAFIAYLADKHNIRGPHVIIGPLTTVRNWMKEFSKWLPNCKAMILEATKDKRDDQIDRFFHEKMEVILTSYESIMANDSFFSGLKFKLLVVDEAHKMKNDETVFSQLMRHVKARFKILLTGTPIHNNTLELWSLLNFVMPEIFYDSSLFTDWTDVNNQMSKNSIFEPALQQMNMDMIMRLRNIISPFMLRRTKDEVEKQIPAKKEIHIFVPLTPLQIEHYKKILFQLNPNQYYQNKLIQLRKLCIHPYCFPELDNFENDIDEHIVQNCGKMKFLDKLLERLLKNKHKVLIFSQFKMMLDILEDYLALRNYRFRRIDGETAVDQREEYIQEFQAPNNNIQIFILSTRAGGLGITLTAADQVIIYDSDYNPQMDLQAMDRAHRIGQTKEVTVYRLAHRSTIEEMIIERQQIKMRWDTLIIGKEGKLGYMNSQRFDKLDLNDLFRDADQLIDDKEITDEDIDTILRVSEEKFQQLNQRLDKQFEDFQKKLDEQVQLGLKSINMMEHFKSKQQDFIITEELISKMKKSQKQLINSNNIIKQEVSFDQIQQKYKHDYYNFYENNERIIELKQKKLDHQTFENAMRDNKIISDIDDLMIEDLTEQEDRELQQLLASGFGWSFQDYQSFIQAFKEFGYQPESIYQKMKNGATQRDINEYLELFTNRCNEIPDGQLDLMIVQKNIKERMLNAEITELLGWLIKIIKYKNNESESMSFIKSQFTSQEIKKYVNEHNIQKPKCIYQYTSQDYDLILLEATFKHGYGSWDKIGQDLEQKFQDDQSFVLEDSIQYLKYLSELVRQRFKVLIKVEDIHLKKVVEKFGIDQSSILDLVQDLDVKQEDIEQKVSKSKKVIRRKPQKTDNKEQVPNGEQNKNKSKSKSKSKSQNKRRGKSANQTKQQEQTPKPNKSQPRKKSNNKNTKNQQSNQQQLKVVAKKPLKARDESSSPDVAKIAQKYIGKKPKE